MGLAGGYEGAGTDMSGDGSSGNQGADFGANFDPEGYADASRADGTPGAENQGGFGGPDDFGPNASGSSLTAPSVSIDTQYFGPLEYGTVDLPDNTVASGVVASDATFGAPQYSGVDFGGPGFEGELKAALAPTGLVAYVASTLAKIAVGLIFGGPAGAAAAGKASIGQLAVQMLSDFFGGVFTSSAPGMNADTLAASVDAAVSGLIDGRNVSDVTAQVEKTISQRGAVPTVATNAAQNSGAFISSPTTRTVYASGDASYVPAPLTYNYDSNGVPVAPSGAQSSGVSTGVLLAIAVALFAGM